MTHRVYKIDMDNSPHYDGGHSTDDKWHILAIGADDARILCSNLAIGAAGDVELISKTVERGGITCPDCLNYVKTMKAIKL